MKRFHFLLDLFHLIAGGIVPATLKHALPVPERLPVLQQTVPIETPSNVSDKLGIATRAPCTMT